VTKNERIARKRLRRELQHSTYWRHLAGTVRDVADDLLVAWAELADARDDHAFTEWQDCLNSRSTYAARVRHLEGKPDTATLFLCQYVSVMTCGALPEEVS
jgi:hypothetical protein